MSESLPELIPFNQQVHQVLTDALRLNALTHGLTAEQIVLPTEDPDQFQDLLHDLLDQYQPVGLHEHQLVEDMVVARWRLRRFRLLDTGFYQMRLEASAQYAEQNHGEDLSDAVRLAYAVQGQWTTILASMSRCEARVERSFYRALHELQLSQARRAAQDPPPSPAPPSDPHVPASPRLPARPRAHAATCYTGGSGHR
ncbi:MAG: hypothetical protein HYZ89_05940 [Candidatus Omnitrophica bacterium]|nr:hypothetical protein [Candidatus Omnitrophota bacterium]